PYGSARRPAPASDRRAGPWLDGSYRESTRGPHSAAQVRRSATGIGARALATGGDHGMGFLACRALAPASSRWACFAAAAERYAGAFAMANGHRRRSWYLLASNARLAGGTCGVSVVQTA